MKFVLFSIIFLSFISCSNYNKVLKGDNYEEKFKLANDLFDREKWNQCISLYEQVYQRLPKTGEGELAYYRIGYAYYKLEDFYMSGYFFNSFFDKYPRSNKTEEAFFLKAISSVKNSPIPSLDQQETEIALNEVQQFIYLFPNSSRIDTCNIIMDNLRFKLEKKEYESVKLYHKTLNYRSVITTAETFLNAYPNSIFKEEVNYLKIKNLYFVAKNSIDDKKIERIEKTIETYRNFASQFPNSTYIKELENIEKTMQNELKALNTTK
jgi:outer membrane protein assembly factor BamD